MATLLRVGWKVHSWFCPSTRGLPHISSGGMCRLKGYTFQPVQPLDGCHFAIESLSGCHFHRKSPRKGIIFCLKVSEQNDKMNSKSLKGYQIKIFLLSKFGRHAPVMCQYDPLPPGPSTHPHPRIQNTVGEMPPSPLVPAFPFTCHANCFTKEIRPWTCNFACKNTPSRFYITRRVAIYSTK